MASPPAVWQSEVTLRCARGTKHVTVVGPTAAAAVRKATEMDTSPYGIRCQVQSVRIVKRGAGAGLAGARPRRRRRKTRR